MSAKKKIPLEGEFEGDLPSEKGVWTNAWSPSWEDTSPSIAVDVDDLREEFPEESHSSAQSDLEEPK
jgi:hypothetical protein